MKEEGNNRNTVLLTVIAIATLLVAIVGATFAYFTAQVRYNDSNSLLEIQSAAGGSATYEGGETITVLNIYPKNNYNWVSKTVNVTYRNTATDLEWEYDLNLVYDNQFSTGALTYTFARVDSTPVCKADGSITDETACTNAGSTLVSTNTSNANDQRVATQNGSFIQTTTSETVELGTGSFFQTTAAGANHTYLLTIQFPNGSGNQNVEQGKVLTARVVIVDKRLS